MIHEALKSDGDLIRTNDEALETEVLSVREVIAVLGCWIPVLGWAAIPVGLLGGFLGCIALAMVAFGGRPGGVVSLVGIALCAVGVAVPVVSLGAVASNVSEAALQVERDRAERAKEFPPREVRAKREERVRALADPPLSAESRVPARFPVPAATTTPPIATPAVPDRPASSAPKKSLEPDRGTDLLRAKRLLREGDAFARLSQVADSEVEKSRQHDKALDRYQQVIREFSDAAEANEARRRMDAMKRPTPF